MKNWDLSVMYNSFEDENFKNDIEKSTDMIKKFDEFIKNRLDGDKVEIIEYYLNSKNEFYNLVYKLHSFAQLTFTTDTSNNKAMSYITQLEMLLSKTVESEVKFEKWLSKVENLDEILNSTPLIKEHSFYLNELVSKSGYLLTDAEEVLYAQLRQTGSSAFDTLQGKVTSTLMIEIEEDGKKEKKPLSYVRSLAHSKDTDLRKRAYFAELDSYKKIEEISAMALNSIKGEAITIAKKRGYESVLDMTLQSSRMDRLTLDTMLEAMREVMPNFRAFFKKKASLLDKDSNSLPFYNLFAPVGNVEMTYSYDEARDLVIKQFNSFSNKLGAFAKNAFDNNWIDPFPKEGKVGGAFCASIHGVKESRILSNFNGSFSDVTTLAHELGHGYHSHVLMDSTIINAEYPMPLAETASIFCETIVFNAALKEAKDDEKISILETDITGAAQVIVDIYSRYLFESELIKKRENGFVSVDELKEIMLQAQKDTYGDGLDTEFMHPYMWACKPHYYSVDYNFYNFPYAFGLLFAKGLYAQYKMDKVGFLDKYDNLLIATGNHTIYDAVKSVGIDLHDINFWRSSLKTITDDIDKFLKM